LPADDVADEFEEPAASALCQTPSEHRWHNPGVGVPAEDIPSIHGDFLGKIAFENW